MDINAAILIMTCDAYSDLWYDFFRLKQLMWPDCAYNTYIATEKKTDTANGDAICIPCGDNTEWTERLRIALKSIDEKYIILMLEDYYISQPVSNRIISEDIILMDNGKYMYLKLDERYNLPGKRIADHSAIKEIAPKTRYGVSLLSSIWNKEYLLDLIEDQNISAWEFELLRNRENDKTMLDEHMFLYDTRNPLHIVHMVERGKYMKRSVIQLKKRGYQITNNGRDFISYFSCLITRAKELSHNIEPMRKLVVSVLHLFGWKNVSDKYAEKYNIVTK